MSPLLLRGKVLSGWGDSSNMSPKDVEEPDDSLLHPLENLKGGDRLSGAGFGMPRCAECALVRASDGRSMLGRLLLYDPEPVRSFPSGTGLMGDRLTHMGHALECQGETPVAGWERLKTWEKRPRPHPG